jgi:hypothetical protein
MFVDLSLVFKLVLASNSTVTVAYVFCELQERRETSVVTELTVYFGIPRTLFKEAHQIDIMIGERIHMVLLDPCPLYRMASLTS